LRGAGHVVGVEANPDRARIAAPSARTQRPLPSRRLRRLPVTPMGFLDLTPPWHAEAACAGQGVGTFVPGPGGVLSGRRPLHPAERASPPTWRRSTEPDEDLHIEDDRPYSRAVGGGAESQRGVDHMDETDLDPFHDAQGRSLLGDTDPTELVQFAHDCWVAGVEPDLVAAVLRGA
jgi:hypothetical protein